NQARGWPTSITYAKGATNFATYSLTYDSGNNTVGNLTGVTELDGSTVSYGYDALYRMTSEARTGTNPTSHSIGYDLAGNATTADGSAWGYDAANKISSLPGGTASYDGDGNLKSISGTSIPSGSFTWDDQDNLTLQSNGGASVSYGYDGLGRRVGSQV